MLSLFIFFGLTLYYSTQIDINNKFNKIREIIEPKCCIKIHKYCSSIMLICCASILFIICIIVLFQFAESGFFSPEGYAKFLIILPFIIKMFIGLRLITLSKQDIYEKIKKLLLQNDALTNTSNINYKMEQITSQQNDNNKDEQV